MFCVSCGKTSQERQIHKLPQAMSPDLGICVVCAEKHQRHVAREADRLLAEQSQVWAPQQRPICGHCLQPVLYVGVDGRYPLWCRACENERQLIIAQTRGGGEYAR